MASDLKHMSDAALSAEIGRLEAAIKKYLPSRKTHNMSVRLKWAKIYRMRRVPLIRRQAREAIRRAETGR